ncbi:tetratricopeptide (TPR) repeat protein [Streptacidiphilus sp. MAP12-20]
MGGPGMGGLGRMSEQGRPSGEVYDWFRRGSALLDQGNAGAAVQLLSHAVEAEPESRAIREALARAQFEARAYAAALENFRTVALADPSDDYAQFGWGLAAARLGDFEASAEHLALAVAMRPSAKHYRAALRQTRATLKARAGGFGTVGGVRPGPEHTDGPESAPDPQPEQQGESPDVR